MEITIIERMMTYLSINKISKSFRLSLLDEIILRHHFKYEKRMNFSAGLKHIIRIYMQNNSLNKDYNTISRFSNTFDLGLNECEKEIIKTYRKLEKEKHIIDILDIIPPERNIDEPN